MEGTERDSKGYGMDKRVEKGVFGMGVRSDMDVF